MGKKLVWLRKRYHDKKWKNNFFSTYFLNGTLGNKICTYCAKKSKFYALLYQKKYFLHFTMKLHFFRLYGWVRILSSETENMKQILWPFFEEIGAFFFFNQNKCNFQLFWNQNDKDWHFRKEYSNSSARVTIFPPTDGDPCQRLWGEKGEEDKRNQVDLKLV